MTALINLAHLGGDILYSIKDQHQQNNHIV